MTYLELVGGLVYLLMGGDLLVRGSVALARRWSLSPLLVGATVVAFGTSAPELFVSVVAVRTLHPELAVGNVIGSNIVNTLLVVGVLALVRPGAGPRETRGDVLTMLGSMGFLIAILWDGRIGRIDGLILLSGLVAFVAAKTGEARAGRSRAGGRDIREWILGLPSRTWLIGLFLAVGSVWLPLGARLFVDASSAIALDLGVSEAVVGLSIVALGTSLPELATAVLAARRAHLDIALGNVIGSNIFNVLAILGTAAAVAPGAISVQRHHAMWNGAVMLGAGAWLAVFLLRGRELSRLTGGLMVLAFVGWIAALYLSI